MTKKDIKLAAILLLVPLNSHAYLDPGSGALIIQAVIGAIAGGLMFIKLYWGKIKQYFSKNKQD